MVQLIKLLEGTPSSLLGKEHQQCSSHCMSVPSERNKRYHEALGYSSQKLAKPVFFLLSVCELLYIVT